MSPEGIPNPSLAPVLAVPLIACMPTALACHAQEGRFGNLNLTVHSDAPTEVVVRRFAFPGWRIDPAVSPVSANASKLVSFTAPPGRTSIRLERESLPAERLGGIVSGISLALLILALAWPNLARPGPARHAGEGLMQRRRRRLASIESVGLGTVDTLERSSRSTTYRATGSHHDCGADPDRLHLQQAQNLIPKLAQRRT